MRIPGKKNLPFFYAILKVVRKNLYKLISKIILELKMITVSYNNKFFNIESDISLKIFWIRKHYQTITLLLLTKK